MKMTFHPKNKKLPSPIFHETGDIIIFALIFMSIFLVMSAGLLGVVRLNNKFTLQKESSNHALEIAEAGINYYHWHLAHNPYDYSDGNDGEGCALNPPYTCGPYTHNYLNDAGQKIGSFELEITPPPAGSTIIVIQSTGQFDKFPDVKRTISTRFGIPSLAEYSFLEDSPMIFSPTSETWGKVHSNYRIEFNGTNHSTVESAEPTSPCGGYCNSIIDCGGVCGDGGPQNLWHWPVTVIDFNKVTQDLSLIKAEAKINGIYLQKTNKKGYHLILQANNSVDIYKVNNYSESTYDITSQTFLDNNSLENVNIIFVEDNVWVEGTVTGLLTIGSARFPDHPWTNTSIYIPDNITYETKDEYHILGLIAQKNIRLSKDVPNDTTVEANLLAQKGKISRPCYTPTNDSLTIYGGMISKKGGGFKCGNPVSGGFVNTYYYSNPEATYHPPPMFPISATSTVISWEEIE